MLGISIPRETGTREAVHKQSRLETLAIWQALLLEAVVRIEPQKISETTDKGSMRARHLLAHQNVLTSAAMMTGIVALRLMLPESSSWENPVMYMLIGMCNALVAMGVIYCLWIQYRVSGHRWVLLSTGAFVCLMTGEFLFIVQASILSGQSGWLGRLGYQYSQFWQWISACLLLAAVLERRTDSREETSKTGVRRLVELLVLVFCLVTIAILLAGKWDDITGRFSGLAAAVIYWANRWSLYSYIGQAFHLTLLISTLLGFTRRYMHEEDAYSSGVTRYLILATTAQFALTLSVRRSDLCWWLAQSLSAIGLLVLLTRLGEEFGRSYTDARARVEHLEAVHYASLRLSKTLDLRVVLLTLVSDTSTMLSARFASVMLADEEGKTLTTAVTHGLPENLIGPAKPQEVEGGGRPAFYSGHTARAFREKRICVVDDVYTDVEFIPWRVLAQYDGYTVSVPLVYQGFALGVLNLFFEKHVPLNDERLRLFQTLATSASIAIVNAQLYQSSLEAGTTDASEIFSLRLAS